MRIARKTAGSQTVQSTAGVLQAQLDGLADRARTALADRLPGHLGDRLPRPSPERVNGSVHRY